MRKSRFAILLVLSAVATFAGCKHDAGPVVGAGSTTTAGTNSDDAIRTAILAHLAHSGTLNIQAFDTIIRQVTMEGDHAQAQVEFHVKNGSGEMQLSYALEKRNGAWAVIESKPVGSDFSHPALNKSQTSSADGTVGANAAVSHALDNFHGGGEAAQNLPPGHPPVVSSPNSGAQPPH